jgi:hypothetical protein
MDCNYGGLKIRGIAKYGAEDARAGHGNAKGEMWGLSPFDFAPQDDGPGWGLAVDLVWWTEVREIVEPIGQSCQFQQNAGPSTPLRS